MLSSFVVELFKNPQKYAFLIGKMIEEDPEALLQLNQVCSQRTRTRRSVQGPFWDTPWGRMLDLLEGNEDLEAYEHRLFRRRFRVPFPVFKYLVYLCNHYNIFDMERASAIPIELKLMVCLRILGRDVCADDITEITGIGESTINYIFHDFIRNFNRRCYKEFVNFPSGEDLKHSMHIYERLGLPGCVGSIDGTKIRWDKCPKEMRNACIGKEKEPTLGFQCVVNHMRKIYHISNYFVGSATDISMCYWDPVTKRLLTGEFEAISETLKDYTFSTYDLEGKATLWKGVYVISDQGYLKRSVFMDPSVDSFAKAPLMWSEWLESVRKDVECTFGILKSRFRFLKNPVKFHHPDTIQDAFKCCAILHNILLQYDELDQINWEEINPDASENADPNVSDSHDTDYATELYYNTVSEHTLPVMNALHFHDTTQWVFKRVLITHFTYCYFKKLLLWPRGFTNKQKELHQIQTEVLSRVHGFDLLRYRVGESSLEREGYYVGKGLFTNVTIPKGATIIYFEGTVRKWEEVHSLSVANQPNQFYTIQLYGRNNFLDCYQHYRGGLCLGSYANSPSGCVYKENKEPAKANAKLVVTHQTAKLIARRTIMVNEEILWSYGRTYKFPEEVQMSLQI